MNSLTVNVEKVSKSFKLGSYNSGTFFQDLNQLLSSPKSVHIQNKYHHALEDISFKLYEGEIVGIVGKNGAGKSTLLKILSRIISPDFGKIQIKGKVSSLLEVGTGFHPELTGRENIYMNGSLLGMKRNEITQKLKQIIEFSGVEKYIDTPVKRYSSGMTVRLGFSVAAHLDSDILIIDEVLAVGDMEFQNKCIKKIKDDISNSKTVLIVSHNLTNISDLCSRSIYLENGKIKFDGDTSEALNKYITDNSINVSSLKFHPREDIPAAFSELKIIQPDPDKQDSNVVEVFETLQVGAMIRVNSNVNNIIFGLGLLTSTGIPINTTWTMPLSLSSGTYELRFKNEKFNLGEGTYKLLLGSSIDGRVIEYIDKNFVFHVVNTNKRINDRVITSKNSILLDQLNYEINKSF